MRPLTESATARVPPASAPTPSGWMNWPAARPEDPSEPSERAADVEDVDRGCRPGRRRTCRPVASTAMPARVLQLARPRSRTSPSARGTCSSAPGRSGRRGGWSCRRRTAGPRGSTATSYGLRSWPRLAALARADGRMKPPAGVEDRQPVVDVVGDDQPRARARRGPAGARARPGGTITTAPVPSAAKRWMRSLRVSAT